MDTESSKSLIQLVVARASEIVGELNVVTELFLVAELSGGEEDGENELPGLVDESDKGALDGVEGLELVGGKLGGSKEENELEAESEEGGVLTGPLLGQPDVSGKAKVVETDARRGALGYGDTLEAGELIKHIVN